MLGLTNALDLMSPIDTATLWKAKHMRRNTLDPSLLFQDRFFSDDESDEDEEYLADGEQEPREAMEDGITQGDCNEIASGEPLTSNCSRTSSMESLLDMAEAPLFRRRNSSNTRLFRNKSRSVCVAHTQLSRHAGVFGEALLRKGWSCRHCCSLEFSFPSFFLPEMPRFFLFCSATIFLSLVVTN